MLYADNLLYGNQTVPLSMLDKAAQGYSHPDYTGSQTFMLNAQANVGLDASNSFSGNLYFRDITRDILNSNINNLLPTSTNDTTCIGNAPIDCPATNLLAHYKQQVILHVGAKDKGTGKENKITIKANSGLTDGEIQKMVKDAELNAAEDRKKVELAHARNQAEATVHGVKKTLTEHGAQLEAALQQEVEAAINKLEEALEGEDKTAIEVKTKTLTAASQKLADKLNAQSQAERSATGASTASRPGGAESAPHATADDNVLDAEVKEI